MHIFLHMGMIFSDLLDTADYTAKCNTFKVNRKISKWYGVSMARQKRCIVVNSRVFIKKKYCLKIVINNKIEKKPLA